MRVFIDTEYSNEEDPKLLSLGMITENGEKHFYKQIHGVDRKYLSDFSLNYVLPNFSSEHFLSKECFKNELMAWFANLPRAVILAADSIIDIKFVINIIGHPNNLSPMWLDLRGLIDSTVYHNAVCKYHNNNRPWHHALYDAAAHRQGWLAWMAENKKSDKYMLRKI